MDILLVEDNPGDARLAKEAFQETESGNALHWVNDGVEAIHFLRRQGRHAGAPRPDLILLDLNLPRKDGREVLAEIKSDADLRRIPVVVLTTSQSHDDIQRAYALNANCYVTKPVVLEEFIRVARTIQEFWLDVVQLPTR
jgi:CheY-like chemotaxis protein